MAYVNVTCADGRPIQALTKLIEQRGKWLNETAEQSCAAVMLDVLVSLRALTTTAKPKRNEIHIENSSLVLSFERIGKGKPRPCLRNGKAKYVLRKSERMAFATDDWKKCKVWKWNDTTRKCVWYVVAHSSKEAQDWAFEKVKKRAQRFRGLARIALSKLMMMSGSKTSQPMDNAEAATKAQALTKVTKTGNGSSYSLEASDLLNYAKLALKGGDASVNQAIMKASNKIASVINQRCKDLLSFNKIETPFPQIRGK